MSISTEKLKNLIWLDDNCRFRMSSFGNAYIFDKKLSILEYTSDFLDNDGKRKNDNWTVGAMAENWRYFDWNFAVSDEAICVWAPQIEKIFGGASTVAGKVTAGTIEFSDIESILLSGYREEERPTGIDGLAAVFAFESQVIITEHYGNIKDHKYHFQGESATVKHFASLLLGLMRLPQELVNDFAFDEPGERLISFKD